jgi:hypothetical protein
LDIPAGGYVYEQGIHLQEAVHEWAVHEGAAHEWAAHEGIHDEVLFDFGS